MLKISRFGGGHGPVGPPGSALAPARVTGTYLHTKQARADPGPTGPFP